MVTDSMLEESAVIYKIENNDVWVETQRQSTCGSCAAKSGCGSAALSEVLGRKRSTVKVLVDDPNALEVGQAVDVELATGSFLRGSMAVYALPLMILLLCAGLGQSVAGEPGAIVGFGLSVLLSVAWLRHFNRRAQQNTDYQPKIQNTAR